MLFILYYYHSILESALYRRLIQISGGLFVVSFTFYLITHFQQFLKVYSPIYQLLGASVILICVSLYFLELLKSNAVLNAFKLFSFYASIGLLIWWLIITPIIFFNIYNSTADWNYVNLKRGIYLFANIFMYTCFIIGLLVPKPTFKND